MIVAFACITRPLEDQAHSRPPRPLSTQLLLQQALSDAQPEPEGKQLAACAAVGATIELINGTVNAVAAARLITARRDIASCGAMTV